MSNSESAKLDSLKLRVVQNLQQGDSVNVTHSGKLTEISAVDLSVIAGKIRTRAERIVERYGASFNADTLVECFEDAQAILRHLDDLQSAIMQNQLTNSLRTK